MKLVGLSYLVQKTWEKSSLSQNSNVAEWFLGFWKIPLFGSEENF